MSMADELGKLERLRQSGALSDAEFAAAKRSLLEPRAPSGEHSIGRAANRYVSFQMGAGIVGLLLFLIVLFAIFLPALDQSTNVVPPSLPGYHQPAITFP